MGVIHRPAALWALCLMLFVSSASALYEGMYCGKLNCYDVLEVTRDTPKKEVGKICRNMLRELHPDKVSGTTEESRNELKQRWDLIRTACETLRDDESKKNYDYLLDNPDEFFRHWWYYHRPRVRTQIDAGLVVIVLLSVISGMQYFFINDSFKRQIMSILEWDTKLFDKLLVRAEKDGHVDKIKKKSGKNLPKDEQKLALFQLYGDEMGLDANLDRCYWSDVVWAKAVRALYKWPFVLYKWGRWVYRHVINDFPYDDEEKELLTRKKLLISERNWRLHTQEYRDNLVAKELWDDEKYKAYKEEQEENFAEYVLRDADFKRYKKDKKKQK